MAVREGLLALLQDEPRYGYQLKTEFESATGGVWPLNVGQVYTTLDRLERDGFVSMEFGDDEQKLYTITIEGSRRTRRLVGGRSGRRATATRRTDAEGADGDRARCRTTRSAVLTRQRSALTSLLQLRRRERTPAASTPDASPPTGEALATQLVTDALIVRAEADLRWLDVCEARIADGPNRRP